MGDKQALPAVSYATDVVTFDSVDYSYRCTHGNRVGTCKLCCIHGLSLGTCKLCCINGLSLGTCRMCGKNPNTCIHGLSLGMCEACSNNPNACIHGFRLDTCQHCNARDEEAKQAVASMQLLPTGVIYPRAKAKTKKVIEHRNPPSSSIAKARAKCPHETRKSRCRECKKL